MDAAKASLFLKRDLLEFELFRTGGRHSVELRQLRQQHAVALVNAPEFARSDLAHRVAFLTWRGYTRAEVEEALEVGSQKDYMALLELNDDAFVPDAAQVSAATSLVAPPPAVAAAAAAAAKAQKQAAAASAAAQQQQASGVYTSASAMGPTGTIEIADGYWRIGTTVFAFRGDMAYFPTPLLGFDTNRIEDVICIAHQLPSGEYGEPQYLPPGFKGVVPDEYPTYEATRVGMTVIARDPDSAGRERYREAVVQRISPELADGDFTVDLQWSHDSQQTNDVDFRDVRLLLHPRVVVERQAEAEEAARQARGSNEKHDSAGAFLTVGEASRSVQLREAREKGTRFGQDSHDPDRITSHVKNFMHFPSVDQYEQPRDLRTGHSFVSQFGEVPPDGVARAMPVCPPSQKARSSVGFRFDLSRFPRHPRSAYHHLHNPIVAIAEQCVKNGAMFVDAEFPPSEYSLMGPACLEPNAPRSHVVWRRLSEVHYRPRLQALGSKAVSCTPGRYAPVWFTELLGAFQMTTEAEDAVSPGEDGWVYGAYVVRLFIEGRWAFVVVDDFVPCDPESGEPVCVSSNDAGDVLWTLLEKALAKLMGSYSALQTGTRDLTVPRAWEDLTSNVVEVIEHSMLRLRFRDDVCSNLCDIVLEEANSCCVLSRVAGTRYAGFGAAEHALWHVDCVSEYTPPHSSSSFYSYHVARRHRSELNVKRIDQIREQLVDEIGRGAASQLPDVPETDVSYWMSSAEYFSMFDRTYCLRVLNNFQKLSVAGTFEGRRGIGSKPAGDAALLANPQYLLSFMQTTECIVVLGLRDRRLQGTDGQPALPPTIDASTLQLLVLKGPTVEKPLDPAVNGSPTHVASTPLIDLREDDEWRSHPSVSVRLSLPGGNYVLVPTVGGESTEGFTIRVFSVSAFYMKLLN